MQLKVLGSGCVNCGTLEARTINALETLGLEAPVEKVTDFADIASYGVMATPALAIDDQVVLAGRVPTVAELVDLITAAAD